MPLFPPRPLFAYRLHSLALPAPNKTFMFAFLTSPSWHGFSVSQSTGLGGFVTLRQRFPNSSQHDFNLTTCLFQDMTMAAHPTGDEYIASYLLEMFQPFFTSPSRAEYDQWQ